MKKRETLRQKQSRFAHMLALLILHAEQLGYQHTLGQSLRCETCPVGHTRSLHKMRLAHDGMK